MDKKQSFQQIVERERGLKRTLNAGQMAMIAIGGAIGTGLFLGSGFAIGFAGPSVLLSYAIGAAIALILMGCLAEMTVAHPTSGSFGAYAEHYVSPWAGFLVRYAYWACIVLAVGTEVTATALYMKYWFPAVPGWFWIAGFSAALVLVNALSVSIFGVVEYWFSVIKIAAIVGFILIGAYVVFGAPASVAGSAEGAVAGFHHYTTHGGFFPKGLWGMWVAVIVSIFSYLSIEMIAVAAGEAEDPEHAITRAFRSTMIRLVLFYLLTLALMLAIVPWTAAGREESPFVKVMEAINIPGAAGVINFVVLVAALSSMNSHHADDVQPVARGLRARPLRSCQPARRADVGAAGVDARHRAGDRAEHCLSRCLVHADDGGIDVRGPVHVDDDLCHTLLLPPQVGGARPWSAAVPHEGLPGTDSPGRRPDARHHGNHHVHGRVPHDNALRCTVASAVERGVLWLVCEGHAGRTAGAARGLISSGRSSSICRNAVIDVGRSPRSRSPGLGQRSQDGGVSHAQRV
ncbi:membrane hypothetical protein [Cupriavidus neocaledonicus]|uniref:Amino acid permease/ SLC12A domain-containing protein n=1 Tax=Cupriavidus neocaledonicus TaxID=1040979 RepID=A0ABY1V9V6_9BURK|nr:membrane hypothetical protein [Cupriavidus neocaledonicus]